MPTTLVAQQPASIGRRRDLEIKPAPVMISTGLCQFMNALGGESHDLGLTRPQAAMPRPTSPPQRLRTLSQSATPVRTGNGKQPCGQRLRPAVRRAVISSKLWSRRCGHRPTSPTIRSDRVRTAGRHWPPVSNAPLSSRHRVAASTSATSATRIARHSKR